MICRLIKATLRTLIDSITPAPLSPNPSSAYPARITYVRTAERREDTNGR